MGFTHSFSNLAIVPNRLTLITPEFLFIAIYLMSLFKATSSLYSLSMTVVYAPTLSVAL